MISLTRRAVLAFPAVAFGQSLIPGAPQSAERRAPIEALQKKVAGLNEKWERRTHRKIGDWAMPYRLFRPAAKGKLPLIVYLHGSGGLGDDNNKQITGGNLVPANLWAVPEIQKRQACYVVAPQTDRGWMRYGPPPAGSQRAQLLPGIGEGAAATADLVKTLIAEFGLDDQRVYLSGQSMGGGGTWHLLAHHGNLFAAAVPYCGSRSLETGAENPNIPVWNFHGDADDTVDIQISRDRIAARRKAGGKPIHTEYAGVGHMVSPWACTEPALPDWLFAQRAQPAAGSFAGKWNLDVSKSKFKPGPAPRSMVMEWTEAGDEAKVVTTGVRADGEPFRQEYSATYDGKERTSRGPWNFNAVVNRKLSDTEREDLFKKDGAVVGASKLELSEDGKRLTVRMKFGDTGSFRVFERVN